MISVSNLFLITALWHCKTRLAIERNINEMLADRAVEVCEVTLDLERVKKDGLVTMPPWLGEVHLLAISNRRAACAPL
jgi:hypothetical protein